MTYGSGQGAGWFGPGVPMTPQAPPEVAGRAFDFPSGYNLINQPRAYEAINFGTLRAFADAYDLLRLIIETRKDAMERLRWVIQPRDLKDKMTPQRRNKIKSVTQLFQRPDGEHNWNSWLRMILEDLFVVDAVTLHRRRTRGGKLIALDQIDGATIRRVLDDWGRTPEGLDETAYQQVLKGMPAVNYTQRDLLYRPRNTRVHKVYGYSPVEQLMMTINIGLRRQVFQLNFFTEGNMPAAMVGVPETWTPDQIRVFQEWFDNILSGNLAERSKTRFVPSAVGKTYIPTQETELFGKAEEWLARVTCFAFSLSPQPFLQMMNRATAQTAQSEAAATGLAPIQNWVKDIIDTILTEDLDAGDYEFIWKGDDELDPVRRQAITDANLKVGQITVNEGRVDQGREPYDDPVYDQPMFMTSNGLAPLALMPTTSGDTTVPGDGSDPQTSEDTAASEDNPDEPKSSSSVKTLDKLIGKADPKQLADFLKTLSEGVTT
jgi:phage portal protein BeeE